MTFWARDKQGNVKSSGLTLLHTVFIPSKVLELSPPTLLFSTMFLKE